jgi:hypothetical protein
MKTKSFLSSARYLAALLSAGGFSAIAAFAAVDPARLGADLTPLGGEKAGNADGSIPAWDGGLVTAPAGYQPGDHHPDPFAGEAPLFTITAANAEQYAGKLTAGQLALLKAYPSYSIPVYKTHRTAASPQRIYDATKQYATTAALTEGGNGITGVVIGIPFPQPESGLEVIWNHLVRYRGIAADRHIGQAAPQRDGSYNLVQFEDEFLFNYNREDISQEQLAKELKEQNVLLYYKQAVTAPARLAGSILVVHETMDQVKEKRRAWIYNAGQRRVRLAPSVEYPSNTTIPARPPTACAPPISSTCLTAPLPCTTGSSWGKRKCSFPTTPTSCTAIR